MLCATNWELYNRYTAGDLDGFCDVRLTTSDTSPVYSVSSALLANHSLQLADIAKKCVETNLQLPLTPSALAAFVNALYGRSLAESCTISTLDEICNLESLHEFGHKFEILGMNEALVHVVDAPFELFPGSGRALGSLYCSIYPEGRQADLLQDAVFSVLLQHASSTDSVVDLSPGHRLAPRHVNDLLKSICHKWSKDPDCNMLLSKALEEIKKVTNQEVQSHNEESSSPMGCVNIVA